MQIEQPALIFFSDKIDSSQELFFRQLRERYPEVMRLHGHFSHTQLNTILAQIASDASLVVINASRLHSDALIPSQAAAQMLELVSDFPVCLYQPLAKVEPEPSEALLVNYQQLEIVYLTYNEDIAEENFVQLAVRYPQLKRLHRIQGLTQGFRLAAYLVSGTQFILIDGDNELLEGVDLNQIALHDKANQVLIYFAKNPINDLCYGYGGIKICPTRGFRNITFDTVDPICSGGMRPVFSKQREVLSVTRFNTSAFNAWKAGFRECAMLSAQLDYLQDSSKTWAAEKINCWLTKGEDRPFGDWTMLGAKAGKAFVERLMDSPATQSSENSTPAQKLSVINQPGWLLNYFQQIYPNTIMVYEKA
ncbi:hypothetical protein [Pedobacter aquatilis]|uniref:hypothetical protein n=1 Tax=Pedobacter aquatilis TaxID=351343 RepID=UPI00292D5CE3|nr:hypothetical protein [Pedobacter aquatilis]